ncbi:dephospho-CoA kinase [Xanthomonas vasicola]|uniref:dephospho-CoA kinase n=1 Tax=Xanthomonas vasicola TaxID=56459 RepID=UPI0001CBF53F|nr:dephospho-CoA kinase [Xanthomonas vasicola]KFA39350.1 dephospho-CoA kinase [Xanthomonas vasicola pv. musacearum NCPPB 4384]AZR31890.1 dephospho-CoA kinase [Xanthomonas vasicola pv. musacearum NCPPB 4379]KFA11343.1 dephospho-CoA kinase [Xanthomonas vasicola pv. musacearum NCPPB 2005]KFA14642.1 dephospho-CoA kinase [Xanthomonas vasicola pv. musacearum NCPPB 4380]KFA17534.1 dephospho-CoA kinase [Xanthomonas vasicola pv. musacearum NCPPB 4392]
MSDFIVGLTGGIASGKSALAAEFEKLGVPVIDADVVARQVVAPGPILDAIVERFGRDILLLDGTLDRQALRQIVFADAAQRQALEAITHPAIRAELRRTALAAEGPYVIVAIPLLAEAGGRKAYPWLDRILVVDVPVAVQHARLIHRDRTTSELANQMISAQASRGQRLAFADDVVTNDGQPTRLAEEAYRLDAHYRGITAARLKKNFSAGLKK